MQASKKKAAKKKAATRKAPVTAAAKKAAIKRAEARADLQAKKEKAWREKDFPTAKTGIPVPGRDENGHFLPGVSGNPSGRSRDLAYIKELSKEHTESAVLALVDVMGNKEERGAARVAAANAILDRAYGKPVQAIAGADGEGAVVVAHQLPEMSDEQAQHAYRMMLHTRLSLAVEPAST